MSGKPGIWRRSKSSIKIEDNRFYLSEEKRESYGAINLVMQANNYNFEQTVAWMKERFEQTEILSAATRYAKTSAILEKEISCLFVPPLPDDSQWQRTYSYLTKTKKLSPEIVNLLHEKGILYADDRHANAILLYRSFNESDIITGAVCMRSDGSMEIVPDTRRRAGCFWVGTGGRESELIERTVIATDSIEVLSMLTLSRQQEGKTIYLAVDDLRCLPSSYLEQIPEVIVAAGKSVAENEIAAEILKVMPNSSKVLPLAQTWNQQLQFQYKCEEGIDKA